MPTISTQDPVAAAAVDAILAGRTDDLRQLLADNPGLAGARLADGEAAGMSRSLLHVATDWPGHFPNVAATIRVLVDAGADVDARFQGPHRETPLHWAASSDDVDALHALLDAGADIDADGGVIAGGSPLVDAAAFGQWDAARALVARGASARLVDLAALGITDEVVAILGGPGSRPAEEVNHAFWAACHGGRLATAQALAGHGAELNWLPGWEDATPLDIATRAGADDVIAWLRGRGALSAEQLRTT